MDAYYNPKMWGFQKTEKKLNCTLDRLTVFFLGYVFLNRLGNLLKLIQNIAHGFDLE